MHGSIRNIAHDWLRQLKKKENEAFGGLKTIAFGDLFQLPPIRGDQAFHQPEKFVPAIHFWRLFSLAELTEDMQQQDDTTFFDLLNALRAHFALLESKMLPEASGDFDLDREIRINPTSAQVDAHNTAVFDRYRTKKV
ncbi:ATP-dependent DNA helicase [Trichonephila inaurata madagascariensis]|uniref:ATP-dependent DNA helicase n=1 Tax=Trichonephila inaurata madagascariensis TaxID=2747483 RepID=A0A8X6WV38_9ARAC|nr:ATP-dependent DNA helicase [Trichonephila inaurata madagascariensis]